MSTSDHDDWESATTTPAYLTPSTATQPCWTPSLSRLTLQQHRHTDNGEEEACVDNVERGGCGVGNGLDRERVYVVVDRARP